MTIEKKLEEGKLTVSPSGRLDTVSTPELEAVLNECLEDAQELELDFSGLEYISSAGLRVLLSAQKVMSRQGSMVVRNVNEDIMDVFELTGFADILTVER